MSKLKLIWMLPLILTMKSVAQDLQIINCSFDHHSDTLRMELDITNDSYKVIYLPIQYWEVEIIGCGNRVLGYPYEKYAVNRIYIYSKEFATKRTTGSKCCFPNYEVLPYFARIQPDSTTKILISIVSQTKLIDSIDYKAEIFLSYYDEDMLISQIKSFKSKKQRISINQKEVSFLLFDGITNIKKNQSTIKSKKGILINKYFELKTGCK